MGDRPEGFNHVMWDTLNDLRRTEQLCDALLIAKDVKFPVHRAVMAACSPYFRALFTNGMQETEKKEIEIADISPEDLKSIVHFAYTQEVDVSATNVESLLPTADHFHVQGVVRACCDFLGTQLNASNCLGIRQFAENYHCTQLYEKAHGFLMRNFKIVVKTSLEYQQLPVLSLSKIISDDHLNIRGEEDVFEAVVRWVDFDPRQRRGCMSELIGKVRLGQITSEYFLENISVNKYVQDDVDCAAILKEAWDLLYEMDLNGARSVDLSNPLVRPRIPNEVLFALGGWSGGAPITFFESYDTRADRWFVHEAFAEGTNARAYHSMVAHSGILYIIGGFDGTQYFNSVSSFNPVTKSWREVAPMYHPRCYVSTAVLAEHVYSLGGYDGRQRMDSAEKYNPKTNQWTFITKMIKKRSDASADSANGKLYIAGGFDGDNCLNTAEVYDPSSQQWTLLPHMSKARSGVGMVSFNGSVYVVGGFDGHRRLSCAEKYDPGIKTWTPVANMYTPRSNFAVAVLDDMMFVIGGFNDVMIRLQSKGTEATLRYFSSVTQSSGTEAEGTYTISHVECYDFRGNEWYDATDMHVNRSALSACVIRDLPNLKEYTFYGCQAAEGSDDSDQSQKDDINIEEMPAELRQQ